MQAHTPEPPAAVAVQAPCSSLLPQVACVQQTKLTQLPEPHWDALAQVEPAAFLSQVSPVHPAVQAHVPSARPPLVPVQVPPVPQLACVQHLESTQLVEIQSVPAAQAVPAGPLLHVSPVHPAVQTHVPPVPVQAPLAPQLDWEQHLESTQLVDVHSVPAAQTAPELLQELSWNELQTHVPSATPPLVPSQVPPVPQSV